MFQGLPAEHGLIHSHRGFRFIPRPQSLLGQGHNHGHRCSERFLLCHGLIPSHGCLQGSCFSLGSSTGHSSLDWSSHWSSSSTKSAAIPRPPASPGVSPCLSSMSPGIAQGEEKHYSQQQNQNETPNEPHDKHRSLMTQQHPQL